MYKCVICTEIQISSARNSNLDAVKIKDYKKVEEKGGSYSDVTGTEVFVGTETNSWNRVEEAARKLYDTISDWCKLYKYIIRPPADLFVRSNNNNLITS